MTLQQFLAILRGRWRLAMATMTLVVAAVVSVSLLLPKKYTAKAQVLVDVKGPDPILGLVLPAQMLPAYMATQVDIVTSQKVALMVVDALRIHENPVAIERWRDETDGVGSIRHFYADLLFRNLEVRPARDSSLLTIAYTAVDPSFSAAVANAFAQAYLDTSVQIKVEPAKQTSGFFTMQTQALRDRLEAAQSRLSAYQRDKGIVSADERLDVENARLAELSTQLTALQAQTVEAAERRKLAQERSARGSAGDVPEVLQSGLIQQLTAEQARLEGRLKEQATTFGPSHPDIVKLREQIAEIKSRVADETATVMGSIVNTSWIFTQREAELKAALEKQRAKVLQIKQVRDDLAVLQRDVENAQKNHDLVAARLGQSTLESQNSQANGVLLNPAVEPVKPSSPRVLLNTAVSAVLGGLLGIAVALAAELRRRRIRSSADLNAAAAVPVMGVLRDRNARPSRRTRAVPGARGLRSALGLRGRPPALSAQHHGGVETHAFAPTLFDALPDDEPHTIPVPPRGTGGDSATAEAAAPARSAAATAARKQPLGRIMVEAGMIQEPAVERILAWARQEKIRFGEAAIQSRLATEAQVRKALAYQFDYPVLERGTRGVSDELVAAFESHNPVVADLRRLRSQIHARQTDPSGAHGHRALQAIAVVSPSPGEGKTFVAANLAVTFSQMGQRTLLIDGDLATGRIHELFGFDNRTGLSAMLNGRILPGAIRRVPDLRDLTVITSGGEAPNATDLLSRETFEHLLTSFRKLYDVVLIDTSAAAGDPDAELIARRAGACVVVAREGRSDFDAVHDLTADLEAIDVSVIGSVLIRA
jgi:chain length determinant protein tyrosine kinase EpsG